LGFLVAQQLVAAGETVLDVPATLASRVQVLALESQLVADPLQIVANRVAADSETAIATL
jgi:hypothetical protein